MGGIFEGGVVACVGVWGLHFCFGRWVLFSGCEGRVFQFCTVLGGVLAEALVLRESISYMWDQ